jgi:hypothetical protein
MSRPALISAVLMLALATPAAAGGWAVTTLDALPDRFVAGETYAIGYTIRQHGATPISVDRTEIRITQVASGKRIAFAGAPDGPVGHYVARVTVPAAGEWSWDVTQGPFEPQALGTLTVLMPSAAAAPSAPAAPAAPAAPTAGAPAVVPATTSAPTPGPNGLLLSGLLIALAGAAVLFGGHLASARRPERV